MQPLITNIQRFSTKDGEGIRTTVFFKGCNMKCNWCHNPECISFEEDLLFDRKKCINCGACKEICKNNCHSFLDGQHRFDRLNCQKCFACERICMLGALEKCGKYYTPQSLSEILLSDRAFFGSKGGITFSGGEPLLFSDYIFEVCRLLKKEFPTIDIGIQTAAFVPQSNIDKISQFLDFVYFDIKDTDKYRLFQNTGGDFDIILSNLLHLDKLGKKIVIKAILIKGVNDNDEHKKNVQALADKLKNCEKVIFFEAHPFASAKYEALSIKNSFFN